MHSLCGQLPVSTNAFELLKKISGGKDSKCAEGYIGPLCQTCGVINDKFFVKSSSGITCEECYSKKDLIIIAVFVFAVFLIILFIFLRLISSLT